MTSDLNLVLLVVMITCAAFVGAVNSKGTAKMTLSYILAFVCLAIAAFKVTQYITSRTQQRNVQIAQQVGRQIVEENLDLMEEREAAKKEEDDQAGKQEIDSYKKAAGRVVYNMRQISSKLTNFNLEADTDDEYEELKGRASFYLGEAKQNKAKVKELTPPKGMESVHENLVRSADVLLYAASKLRRYYNAEDAQEEMETARIFRSKNRQAGSLLSRMEMDLR